LAQVIVSPTALRDLETLIRTHSLPSDTRDRVRRSIERLRDFPLLGAGLHGRWSGYRFVLGPWRWMIVVYESDPDLDRVAVVTIQDGRAARSPTSDP
jgi:plasmid stabilization system protein ParE